LFFEEDGMADGVQEPEIRRIAAETAEGVDRLYRRYGTWLLRTLATRFRATAIEVDDLVQETFLRVARYPAEDAARHPQALLSRIAVNLARDQLRRNVVHGGLGNTELDPFCDRVVEDDRHEQLVLKQLVLGLPRPLRDVFLLSRYTGLTYDEIARHLGISVKTVEWRMSKALALCALGLRD
jgi:RNA polymerase sigma factor (sigma-70 family)